MRFLADENVELTLVRWLRSLVHDVEVVDPIHRGGSDPSLLGRSVADDQVVLTNDLDFGELVVLHQQACAGLILLRMERLSPAGRLAVVQRFWPAVVGRCVGNIVVISNQNVRIRPIA